MLLEIAIFDAYGYGFEYAKPNGHRQNDLRSYYSHPKWRQIPGHYSDDTEMSIAIAELLVDQVPWSPANIADKFVSLFNRNNRRTGYSARFYEFLCSVNNGREFLTRIRPHSEKSGAAMRSCPIGLLLHEEDVLDYAAVQASVTHNTPAGIASSQAVALAVHYFTYGVDEKKNLGSYLEDRVCGARFGHDLLTDTTDKVGELGMESVHAAVTALRHTTCMQDLLKLCVEFGGDVDTVAAIAGGIASCAPDYFEQNIPENLVMTLENGEFGRDFLVKLDRRLVEFKRKINNLQI